jgi:hypothetical protein
MAVLSEGDFTLGAVHIWTFSAKELEDGHLDGVHIDTGDQDADHLLRQVPIHVWETIALRALAFRCAQRAQNAEMALRMERKEPGTSHP